MTNPLDPIARYHLRQTIYILLVVLAAGGCSQSGDEPIRTKNSVFVGIVPLEFFVQRVGGSRVEVHSLVGPGQSPATYEPTTRQLAALADAKLFFTVGVPIETQLLPRIRTSFPGVGIVDLLEGVPLAPPSTDRLGQVTDGGADHHHEFDPHVWLSPRLAAMMSRNMLNALSRIDPDHSDEYRRNFEQLEQELARLDAEIERVLAPIRGEEMVVFHPAYGYFAEEYGLRQVAIEAGGVTPSSQQLARLIEHARARQVKAIYVQPQFSPTAAQMVADEIGAEVIELDPLSRDYVKNLRAMAIKILSVHVNG